MLNGSKSAAKKIGDTEKRETGVMTVGGKMSERKKKGKKWKSGKNGSESCWRWNMGAAEEPFGA